MTDTIINEHNWVVEMSKRLSQLQKEGGKKQ